MINKSIYYVYVIFHKNGHPVYVGKGKGRRAEHHAKFSHSRHLKNLYKKYGDLPLVKIRENLSEKEACETEIAFISAIGRRDLGTGPLVNLSNGGEGLSGHIKSKETREKISKAHKGRVKSPEECRRISAGLKGKKRSPESCAKQSKTMMGRPAPWITEKLTGIKRPDVSKRQAGSKHPETSKRLLGNKYSQEKNTVISKKQALLIRDYLISGYPHKIISSKLKINREIVSAIATGRSWAHLGPPIRRSKRLTIDEANQLRKFHKNGMPKKEIESKFGITISSINRILKGTSH